MRTVLEISHNPSLVQKTKSLTLRHPPDHTVYVFKPHMHKAWNDLILSSARPYQAVNNMLGVVHSTAAHAENQGFLTTALLAVHSDMTGVATMLLWFLSRYSPSFATVRLDFQLCKTSTLERLFEICHRIPSIFDKVKNRSEHASSSTVVPFTASLETITLRSEDAIFGCHMLDHVPSRLQTLSLYNAESILSSFSGLLLQVDKITILPRPVDDCRSANGLWDVS